MSTHVRSSSLAQKYGPWAVVTGASSGIGAEFARQLAVAGLSVVLVARREARLRTLAASLASVTGVTTLVVCADLTHADGISRVVCACRKLDVGLLVSNAGAEMRGSFFHAGRDAHRALIQLNAVATAELTHAFGRRLVERGRGGMVLVSSVLAAGATWFATYGATKAFVSALGLAVRDEVRRSGVDVLVLEPGLVASEMTLGDGARDERKPMMMGSEQCVAEALRELGRRAVWTPGLMNRVIVGTLAMLPRSWAMWIMAEGMRPFLEAENFEYAQGQVDEGTNHDGRT